MQEPFWFFCFPSAATTSKHSRCPNDSRKCASLLAVQHHCKRPVGLTAFHTRGGTKTGSSFTTAVAAHIHKCVHVYSPLHSTPPHSTPLIPWFPNACNDSGRVWPWRCARVCHSSPAARVNTCSSSANTALTHGMLPLALAVLCLCASPKQTCTFQNFAPCVCECVCISLSLSLSVFVLLLCGASSWFVYALCLFCWLL